MKIIILNFLILMALFSAEAENNFYFSKNISINRDSFICPKNMIVGLDARDCYATVKFPIPLAATDSAALCGYEISFPKELNERVRRTNLKGEYPISYTYFPVGDYPIEYFYADSIEKKIICVMNLSVRDLKPPMVILREQNEIKLDSSGTKTIAASFFDAGTCDKCSAFDFKVSRKKLNAPEKDWTKMSDFVTFTCEDAGDTVLVKLIAIQKRDKFPEVVKNEGISIAIVHENPSAKFVCPPHLTVNLSDLKLSKDEMLNYDEQTLQYLDEHFGAVRNLESERKSIIVLTADSTSGYMKTEIKDGVVSRCRKEKIYRHADVLDMEINYEQKKFIITKFLRQFSIYPFPIERSCQHGQPIPEYNEQMSNNDAGGCFQILTIK